MKKIRNSKTSKVIAMYLALMLILEILAPMQAYALTGGPAQPEFNSFTPIGTSDMVDLASGDFNYNIPIMDVGGYPLNLAYNSGITMDQEASWVGLGWDLNVGQINRQMRGLPDDFDGDEMLYENNMKENVTVGGNVNAFFALLAVNEANELFEPELNLGVGLGVEYNNYVGYNSSLSTGLTYQFHENVSVGFNLTSSEGDGVSISPKLSFDGMASRRKFSGQLGFDMGVSLNSRKGLQSITMAPRISASYGGERGGTSVGLGGGSISYIDATYTPSKRAGMVSSNFSFNLNTQVEMFGAEPGVKFTGYKVTQGFKGSEKRKTEKAFGFENTYNATDKDIIDFNREKERSFNKHTTTLPVVNHTFDIYSIHGQGIGGMFRPFKSQVGYVYDDHVDDDSNGGSIGIEFGGGGGIHFGIDGEMITGSSSTKAWRSLNPALARFEEKKTGNRPDYEKVYFKTIGGNHVDYEYDLLQQKLGGYDPVMIKQQGSDLSVSTASIFEKKNTSLTPYTSIPITGAIKRNGRVKRNQAIQKLTRKEALKYGFDTQFSPYSLSGKHDHHTTEIRVLKDGGERYIYGRAAYNVTKKEVTFDVTGRPADCHTGLVDYGTPDNSINNNRGGDNYFNGITTPAYAHTYLLTAVLSSDYSDLKNDGPSDDDLGSYTQFIYNDENTKTQTYKWRVPYQANKANYDEGLKTSTRDNKGNYVYGEKELIYINKIVTKTHVAVFKISPRKDGYGVEGEDGGGNSSTSSRMYKLDKITLYSKSEFEKLGEEAIPIKEAHFEYDYSLCPDVPNNFTSSLNYNEMDNQGGKLTLKKVYFTYRNSKMGKYTPYIFNYDGLNPSYDIKAYDTWGNYKPNPSGTGCGVNNIITNPEFPYVDQTAPNIDAYASAWHLTSIELPSGGKIEVEYESDRYRYVQDKEVMQMFQVAGVGTEEMPNTLQKVTNNILYQGTTDTDKLYIKLPCYMNEETFAKKYIRYLSKEPIYFRFLLNMAEPGTGHPERYDYVTGYLKMSDNQCKVFEIPGYGFYASIPIQTVNRGDGINSGQNVNPIAKAGWHFGREYLNRFVYTNPQDESTDDLEEIVMNLLNTVPQMVNIFKSPNKQLIDKDMASRFIKGKSWIRLMHPDENKSGGGSRVREIKMYDSWDKMTNHDNEAEYIQTYGQKYTYETEDGFTSGVATYEPIGNKENPLVQPFYGDIRKLQAPQENNYIELPLGECFYPSPKITYSRVTVQNLPRTRTVENTVTEVKRHATGKVVTEFYTTKDYPTIEDYTKLYFKPQRPTPLAEILAVNVIEHLNYSQGFVYHTNDMDGKMKSQKVYGEGQTSAISGVDYIYDEIDNQGESTYDRNQGKLDNTITTIDSKGVITQKLVGVDYDVVNDFTENRTVSQTGSGGVNIQTYPVGPIPLTVFVPIPKIAYHENQLRTSSTTKVIHTTGILREKRVFDAGSSVYTRNLAWDADTGDVLLTETINEYNDRYYSFNFPAYWAYDGMKQAAKNLGLTSKLKRVIGSENDFVLDLQQYIAADFLGEGDEVWIKPDFNNVSEIETELAEIKAYVVNINGTKFNLITEEGMYIKPQQLQDGEFKIIRSGYRNMQTASMASIVSMVNPLLIDPQEPMNEQNLRTALPNNVFSSSVWSDYRIVNASAIEYNDEWAAQCECNLPKMQYDNHGFLTFDYRGNYDNSRIAYNPYKYNIKGNWRPKVSYAYLTGRNASTNPNPRKDGFFNDFAPYYVYSAVNKKWIPYSEGANFNKWTYASEVTQYNPFGFELENKDALNRYSTALYGYNFRFPTAVASNTKYSELAFDGFEDYELDSCKTESHFKFSKSLEPNNIYISDRQSHTGRKSLKVLPTRKAQISKRIIPCEPESNQE